MTTDQRIDVMGHAVRLADAKGWSVEQALETILKLIREDSLWT